MLDDGERGTRTARDARSRLTATGMSARTVVAAETGPLDTLLAAVPDHDAIVTGEQATSLQSFLLGDVTTSVAAEFVGPVLVVQREPSA